MAVRMCSCCGKKLILCENCEKELFGDKKDGEIFQKLKEGLEGKKRRAGRPRKHHDEEDFEEAEE